MSYTQSRKLNLDSVLPQFKKISQAPSADQIRENAARKRIPLDQEVRNEQRLWYKALDSDGKTISLCKCPGLAYWQTNTVLRAVGRIKPVLYHESLDLSSFEGSNSLLADITNEKLLGI